LESHITVTALDHERLQKLVHTWSGTRDRDAAEALADELDRAEVVPAERIADSVVTMNSRVVFQDEKTGESREVSLVYPMDSDPEQGRISVLSPVGSALLGLSVGQTIDWPLPRGRPLLGEWAAARLYLLGAQGDDYANSVVHAQFEEPGVVAKVGIDLRTKGIVATDDELRSELARFTEEAERQIMAE
jgi:regulator of nucleoside diphosphate kinase